MFGRLNLDAFKHDAIENGAVFSMILAGAVAVFLLFYFKRWKWLWEEWITSLDPKRIGVMYIIVSAVMLFKGISDAAMQR